MNSIKEALADFYKVYPKDITELQRNEIARCFYAGALCAFSLSNQFSLLPANEGLEKLKQMHEEILSFIQGQRNKFPATN